MVWITCMYLTAYQLRIVELLKCVNTDWHFPPVTDLQWTFAVFMKCKCDLSFNSNVFMDIISNPTIHKSRSAKCSIQHLHIITLPIFFYIYIYMKMYLFSFYLSIHVLFQFLFPPLLFLVIALLLFAQTRITAYSICFVCSLVSSLMSNHDFT